ncbi:MULTISPECIES: hypothetical protein [unclassified Burkholderia]|uniref:hypothetical protein n=1 Tax=unclassified Burkholderia TaxID=2613784 RepID=UPI00158BECD5|nr:MULTISPECIES: hypothetical protein [unclassified Burkholderia]
MKAGARDRLADMSPGFCLKNIGTKLLQKISVRLSAEMAAPHTRCRPAHDGRNEWA